MNQAERIYRIHHLFKSRRLPIPHRELQDELEVSRATLTRDLGYMRDFFGAPIQCARDGSGCRYDPDAPEFELPGLWFNDSELHALLASEQLLESVQPGLLAPHLGPLKARIRKLLEKSGHRCETVSQRIRLQAVGSRPVDNKIFGRIAGAVLDGHCLDVTYEGRERGEPTQRRIHPWRLLHYRDNWFLIAWCERADDQRTLAIDRIRKAATVAAPVNPPDEARLERYLNASFGIFTGEAKEWATLRFSARAARWVADEIWHPDQIGCWIDGAYELRLPYSDQRELVMEILKYGPDVEVTTPESLRQFVASRIREASARYGCE